MGESEGGSEEVGVEAKWDSSHQQSNTATARRSRILRPHTVGDCATGSTHTVLSLVVRLSMHRAATSGASRLDTGICVLASSNPASTARSLSACAGCKSVSISMFKVSAQTSGAATDSDPACMRLHGWTGSRCAGSRTAACGSRKLGSGRASDGLLDYG
jgi:hypothetical protein